MARYYNDRQVRRRASSVGRAEFCRGNRPHLGLAGSLLLSVVLDSNQQSGEKIKPWIKHEFISFRDLKKVVKKKNTFKLVSRI